MASTVALSSAEERLPLQHLMEAPSRRQPASWAHGLHFPVMLLRGACQASTFPAHLVGVVHMLITAVLQYDCRELEHLLQRARRQLLWLGIPLLAWHLELQVSPRRDMLVIVSIQVVEQRQPLVKVALRL